MSDQARLEALNGLDVPPILPGQQPPPVGATYYNPQSKPISLEQWIHEFQPATFGHAPGRTELADGTMISTVYLGLNHSHGDGLPLIFETMIRFADDEFGPWQWRYATAEAAGAGHEAIVAVAREALARPPA